MNISVIIPVYNRPILVKRAIDSVLNQIRPANEIIVVNDGSTDETSDSLLVYKNKMMIVHQKNAGVSAARNHGIKIANGEWIAFLDSDDEWLPDKLKNAERYIKENPHIDIFQSNEIWIRNGKRVNPKRKHKKQAGDIFKASLELCLVSPSAVLLKRKLLNEVGFFDESLTVCEDYDLWLRISKKYPVGLCEKNDILKYGGHKDQLSQRYWGMDLFRIQAMKKHINDPYLSAENRKALYRTLLTKYEILIKGFKKRGKNTDSLAGEMNRIIQLAKRKHK
jgi:glycosyltransferase involved in cell wall biosynthesis